MVDYGEVANNLRACLEPGEPDCSRCTKTDFTRCQGDLLNDALAAIEDLSDLVDAVKSQLPKSDSFICR